MPVIGECLNLSGSEFDGRVMLDEVPAARAEGDESSEMALTDQPLYGCLIGTWFCSLATWHFSHSW